MGSWCPSLLSWMGAWFVLGMEMVDEVSKGVYDGGDGAIRARYKIRKHKESHLVRRSDGTMQCPTSTLRWVVKGSLSPLSLLSRVRAVLRESHPLHRLTNEFATQSPFLYQTSSCTTN